MPASRAGRVVALAAAVSASAACAAPASARADRNAHSQAFVQPPTSYADSALASAVESFARARAAADSFSGVVMLARHGTPLLRLHFGVSDRATGARNDSETLFNLASVDKHFARLAISALVRSGTLTTRDTVGRHLPAYPNPRVRTEVTIQHLLSMRSGVAEYSADYDRYLRDRLRLRTLDDFLPLFAAEPLRFTPGSKAEYSNAGYVVLGKVIEATTGETYHDHVQRQVFDRYGMTRSGYPAHDARVPNLAIGYTTNARVASLRGPDGRAAHTSLLPYRGSSAGGGYASANDLLALSRALARERNGQLDTLLSVKPNRDHDFEAEGWTGGAEGVNTVFYMHSTGHTLIVLSNFDPPSATVFRNRLWNEWLPQWLKDQRPR